MTNITYATDGSHQGVEGACAVLNLRKFPGDVRLVDEATGDHLDEDAAYWPDVTSLVVRVVKHFRGHPAHWPYMTTNNNNNNMVTYIAPL